MTLHHLHLHLEALAVVFPRLFKIVMHALHIGHEIGQLTALDRERPVIFH